VLLAINLVEEKKFILLFISNKKYVEERIAKKKDISNDLVKSYKLG